MASPHNRNLPQPIITSRPPSNTHSTTTTAIYHSRVPRYVRNSFSCFRTFAHKIIPFMIFLHFIISGAIILIYALQVKKTLPTKYTIGAAATFGLLGVLLAAARWAVVVRERCRKRRADEDAEMGRKWVLVDEAGRIERETVSSRSRPDRRQSIWHWLRAWSPGVTPTTTVPYGVRNEMVLTTPNSASKVLALHASAQFSPRAYILDVGDVVRLASPNGVTVGPVPGPEERIWNIAERREYGPRRQMIPRRPVPNAQQQQQKRKKRDTLTAQHPTPLEVQDGFVVRQPRLAVDLARRSMGLTEGNTARKQSQTRRRIHDGQSETSLSTYLTPLHDDVRVIQPARHLNHKDVLVPISQLSISLAPHSDTIDHNQTTESRTSHAREVHIPPCTSSMPQNQHKPEKRVGHARLAIKPLPALPPGALETQASVLTAAKTTIPTTMPPNQHPAPHQPATGAYPTPEISESRSRKYRESDAVPSLAKSTVTTTTTTPQDTAPPPRHSMAESYPTLKTSQTRTRVSLENRSAPIPANLTATTTTTPPNPVPSPCGDLISFATAYATPETPIHHELELGCRLVPEVLLIGMPRESSMLGVGVRVENGGEAWTIGGALARESLGCLELEG